MHALMHALARFGYVAKVLLAYNMLSNHLTSQLLHFEGQFDPDFDDLKLNPGEGGRQRSQLEINTMNAQYKLQKYRKLLTSPVYAAAIVLLPWVKWTYLEGISSDNELDVHKAAVLSFYNTHYKDAIIPEVSVVPPVAPVIPVIPPGTMPEDATRVCSLSIS